MGYNLNTEAYKLFIQIEVGLREFLIKSITEIGVYEWTYSFLGNVQRETINEVSKRINDAYKNNLNPEPADEYFFKLNRAKQEAGFLSTNLFHPFYYLNWTDIENLLRMKSNVTIIEKQIGKLNRETIIVTLTPLKYIRNDVAHSRFISDESYKFLKASFDKILILIPNFQNLISNQTSEQTLGYLITELKDVTTKLETGKLLELKEIDEINKTLSACENSFWLNSQNLILIKQIKELSIIMKLYKTYREKQGGLLEIQNLKPTLSNIIIKIKTSLNE